MELTRSNFTNLAEEYIKQLLMYSDLKERFQQFTNIMDRAREFGLEDKTSEIARKIAEDFNEPPLWEMPVEFEKKVEMQGFPLSSLPDKLREFVEALSAYVQVYPEMCVLPLLSVLSLCVQGKAVVKHPGNSHTEELNLYTLTVAPPGERKSGVFKALIAPVDEYEKRWNMAHKRDLQEYKSKKSFYENKRQNALKGRNASLEDVQEADKKLNELKPVYPKKLTLGDITPEALVQEMAIQGEKMGILDDEGIVFDVLGGIYSSNGVNLGIFLKGYDGSKYTASRTTRGDFSLYKPLLTVGLMTQPKHFKRSIENECFVSRGFIHRFMFAFPESKTGSQTMVSSDIPLYVRDCYGQLITRLLNMPETDTPQVIAADYDACQMFDNYHQHLQKEMATGGHFADLKEWASKHFARCLKIAALLHLCEHSPLIHITKETALNAISIAMWAENQALSCLGSVNISETESDAKYVLEKILSRKKMRLSKSEILRICRKFNAKDINEILDLLKEMNYIRVDNGKLSKTCKQTESIYINPVLML